MDTPTTNISNESPGNAGAEQMFFRVSAGLKRIIGQDLITNEFVAIFELVKNSFDAHATFVKIILLEDSLIIFDNGKGMSLSDIKNKWLFVAYSAKRDGTEDLDLESYRNRIGRPGVYAGSKGVGRFSCDRLGRFLRLQSKQNIKGAKSELIAVDWDLFENDDKEDFVKIPVTHSSQRELDLPFDFPLPIHGTILEISGLRQVWDRKKLLSLKAALAKLINPFGDTDDKFEVSIIVPDELAKDFEKTEGVSPFELEAVPEEYHEVVNGPVKNFIFSTLEEKTTHLVVNLNEDGSKIFSTLIDRGEQIYRIVEENPYKLLADSEFRCQLYYLNRSAKLTFASRMGLPSVQFGSVFLFRNGFRVFPVGEEGDDTLGIDRRRQQGYARFLGTRDLIGKIDVTGSEVDFKETSSRDQGLIQTPAYFELVDIFWEKCLKRLERYVVDITWKDKADKDYSDISRLLGDKGSSRITNLVARLANAKGIQLLDYSPNLVRIINEKSEDFEDSLKSLRIVAERTQNSQLLDEIGQAHERYEELKKAEAEARAQAEREREARKKAEARAKEAEAAQELAETAYEEEKKRSLFLTSISSLDQDTVLNLHHQIIIYASDIHNLIANQIDKIMHEELLSPEELLSFFENISFKNQKILSASRFATKANFRLDSEEIKEDIADYIIQYVENICPLYSGDGIDIDISYSTKGLALRFKPIEISILIDNLISNAIKARASLIRFEIDQPNTGQLDIVVTDNGAGLDKNVIEPSRIFEKGYSTTSGSGLGLYHVSYILDQMGGSIEFDHNYEEGAKFIIRIFK